MKKVKQKKILLIIILIVIFAFLTGRHFSAKRLSVVTPLTPAVQEPIIDAEPHSYQEVALPEQTYEPGPVLPVEKDVEISAEQETAHPEWFKNMLALHETYYPSWQTRTMAVSQGIQRGSPASSHSASSSPGVSSMGTAVPSASRTTPRTRQITHTDSTVRDSSGHAVASAGSERFGGGVLPTVPGDGGSIPDDGGSTPAPPDDGGPVHGPVSIVRTIDSNGYVTLDISVHSDISGLIVTETLSDGSYIKSATPGFSKRSGTSYTWLIYARSLDSNQRINYTVTGSGSISGQYRSTKGSGMITGISAY